MKEKFNSFEEISENYPINFIVKVQNIEEIMNLIKKYNNAIIFYPENSYYSSFYKYPVIKIYDDYIE